MTTRFAGLPTSACLLALLAGHSTVADEALDPRFERRLVYSQVNLQVAANADGLIRLIRRAHESGYNGLVLADYKLNILDRVPDQYFANVRRVKAEADALGMEIIPCIFPIGYSAGLLAHDPNLAEGLPVVDSPHVIKSGRAVLDPHSKPILVNGGFEDSVGDTMSGYGFQDDPGRATFADQRTTHGGTTSLRIEGRSSGGNRRIMQRAAVRPFGCYRFSGWVKTENLESPGSFRLLAIGAGDDPRPLTFLEGRIGSTQDWTRISVVFNSLNNRAVNLYAGTWGDPGGKLWIDDLAIEELSLVNVLRRQGCPFSVVSEDGSIAYQEGRDYAPLADPKLGQVPYAGEYEFDHEGPEIRLVAGSRISEGQRLQVSWYHPVLIHETQVCCCLSEPAVYRLLQDQARRVRDLLQPTTYFMSHDELRVANWCQSCRSRGMTPGELLADNARRCVEIVHELDPEAEILVWSDMFDPEHNAVDAYYLVNGSLNNSWLGLPPSLTIANWNGGRKSESLRFFANRGHKQVIAGYYDTGDLSGFTSWQEATRDVPGVVGFMYTTWRSDYGQLEIYGRAMRTSDP